MKSLYRFFLKASESVCFKKFMKSLYRFFESRKEINKIHETSSANNMSKNLKLEQNEEFISQWREKICLWNVDDTS